CVGHARPEVRAAAAVALGRIEGSSAIPRLMPLLADDSLAVREAAVLALGATGSVSATPGLLHLAQDGRPAAPGDNVPPAAPRPLALLALGVARRHGLADVADGFVQDIVTDAATSTSDVETAGLLYASLSPSPGLDAFAMDAMSDARQPTLLRCRATENQR